MQMCNPQPGDFVRLKSGGPKMVVGTGQRCGPFERAVEACLECHWFEGDRSFTDYFSRQALVMAGAEELERKEQPMAKTQTSDRRMLSNEQLESARRLSADRENQTMRIAGNMLDHIDAQAEQLKKANDDIRAMCLEELEHQRALQKIAPERYDSQTGEDLGRHTLIDLIGEEHRALKKDKELLDFLEAQNARARYGGFCVFRISTTGRGWRLHETSTGEHETDWTHGDPVKGVREAIRQALDQKPKPEPPEYVAGPPNSAFPGW